MNDTLAQFKQEVNEFLAMSGMLKTDFGKEAARDASFVQRLMEGRDVRVRKMDEVRSYMAGKRAEMAARSSGC